jgi:O-antigen ligase
MGVGFIAYVTLVSFTSPYSNSRHAVTWTLLTAFLLVVVPLVLGRYPADTALLRAFDVLGLLLAVMALVESRSRHNPLDPLYAHSPDHLTQSWGVYRVFTTLGHPLVNGTVFAVTLTVVWCSFLKKPSWSRALLMAGLVGAIFVTASRGALLAAGVGVVVAVVARMAGRGGRSRKFTAVILILVAVAGGTMAWSSSVLGERNSSVEGADSADLRLTLLKRTPDMLHQTHFLGSGADTSFAVWQQIGGVYSKYPLENSVIQFVVDFGVLGTLLYVAFVLALALPAVRRGAVTGPAALAAYLVGAGGFNLFEAYPSALVIPSLLLTLTVMEARAAGAAAEAPTVGDGTRAPAVVAAAATTAASVVAGAR